MATKYRGGLFHSDHFTAVQNKHMHYSAWISTEEEKSVSLNIDDMKDLHTYSMGIKGTRDTICPYLQFTN